MKELNDAYFSPLIISKQRSLEETVPGLCLGMFVGVDENQDAEDWSWTRQTCWGAGWLAPSPISIVVNPFESWCKREGRVGSRLNQAFPYMACGAVALRMDWWFLDRPQLSPSSPYSLDDLDPVRFTAYLLYPSKKWSWQCLQWGITFNGLIKRSKLPLVSNVILVKVGPQVPAADAIAVGLNIKLEYHAEKQGKSLLNSTWRF